MNFAFLNFFQQIDKKNRFALVALLFLAIFLMGLDLFFDGFPHLNPLHLSIHIALITLYLATFTIFVNRLIEMKVNQKDSVTSTDELTDSASSEVCQLDSHAQPNNTNQTEQSIESNQTLDSERVPSQPNDCLTTQMQLAFAEWKLTSAEQKVASMLVLGHSLKEIAENCHRGEGTIRQHATIIYKKAQLSGRAKLTGYFLQRLIDTDKMQLPTHTQQSSAHETQEEINNQDSK